MGSIPLETTVTMIVSILIACGGIIFSQIARANSMALRSEVLVLQEKVRAFDTACIDFKAFEEESREDRGELREGISGIEGDIKALMAQFQNVAKQMDAVYRKVFNGSSKDPA